MLRTRFFVVIIVLAFVSSMDMFGSNKALFNFLRYNSSARSSALAGCVVSLDGDASAVVYNPALISTVEDKEFSTTFFKHVLDINSGLVSYTKRDVWDGTIAATVSYTNYGSFEGADIYANKLNTFTANDISMAFTYSNELDERLYYGVTGKFVFVNLEKQNSLAFAIDAGLLYQMLDDRTNIGVSILHAGTQLARIYDVKESLPLDIRAGFNHRLRGLPLLFNFSFHHLADDNGGFARKFENFAIGGEFSFGKYIQARLGYDNHIRRVTSPSDSRKLSGFSAGLGIKTKNINFDYGIAQVGTSATLHRFSLGLSFE